MAIRHMIYALLPLQRASSNKMSATCGDEETIAVKSWKNQKAKFCVKCKTARPMVLVRSDAFCRPCYTYSFVGKFRKVINKARSVSGKPGEKVLVAFSGGPSSRAMLELVSQFIYAGANELKKAQLFAGVRVCHIDESALFGPAEGTRGRIERIVKDNYPSFPIVSVNLEEAFSEEFTTTGMFRDFLEMAAVDVREADEFFAEIKQVAAIPGPLSNKEKLLSFFNSIGKLSAKEDMYWHMKLSLLMHIAGREGCTRLFLGDSSTRLAVRIISLTSKGRGYSLPLDIGVEVTNFPNLVILRPMKDMLAKEIAIWNRYKGLDRDVLPMVGWDTMQPGRSSIERLTEDFLVGLDRDFPSTVSTIARTAGKLMPASGINMEKSCVVCSMPIQDGIKDWRARITLTEPAGDPSDTRFEVPPTTQSSTTVRDCASGCGCCSTGGEKCSFRSHVAARSNLTDHLCYNCQVNLRDFLPDQTTVFPQYVAERVNERTRTERLRKQVEDFLLSDDDNDNDDDDDDEKDAAR